MRYFKESIERLRIPCLLLRRVALCLAVIGMMWLSTSSAKAASPLIVTPLGLSFVAVEGGSNPPAQLLTIITPGSTAGSWFATSSGSWIQVIPITGTTPGSAFVSANVADLAAGTYTGTILVISRQTGTSQVVSVSLTVTPQSTQSQ